LATCQKGLSVGFTTASALVHELHEARDEKRLLRLQRQLAGYKLLIIDKLGYVPLWQTGAELLFEVFSQRYERGSTVVTSNLPFDEWTAVFAPSGSPARSSIASPTTSTSSRETATATGSSRASATGAVPVSSTVSRSYVVTR
jgi:DNA replication protein DnaC